MKGWYVTVRLPVLPTADQFVDMLNDPEIWSWFPDTETVMVAMRVETTSPQQALVTVSDHVRGLLGLDGEGVLPSMRARYIDGRESNER